MSPRSPQRRGRHVPHSGEVATFPTAARSPRSPQGPCRHVPHSGEVATFAFLVSKPRHTRLRYQKRSRAMDSERSRRLRLRKSEVSRRPGVTEAGSHRGRVSRSVSGSIGPSLRPTAGTAFPEPPRAYRNLTRPVQARVGSADRRIGGSADRRCGTSPT
jgi:hypothetical protein